MLCKAPLGRLLRRMTSHQRRLVLLSRHRDWNDATLSIGDATFMRTNPRNAAQLRVNECFGLLTGQTLPVLQSARLEAAKPIGTFFTSRDPTYPDVILAFS